MKRIAATLLLSLLFLSILTAAPVDEETARHAAVQWLQLNGGAEYSSFEVREAFPFSDNGVVTHYVINMAPDGFVIISGDDIAAPVIMYGAKGSYDGSFLPPSLENMLNAFSGDLIKDIADGQEQSAAVRAMWRELREEQTNLRSYFGGGSSISSVSPLVTTTWNQTFPYNKFCPPTSTGGSGGYVYTGCVATAMAQIMKYHDAPTTGVGSNSYTHPTYGTLSANFGNTTYQWSSMPNSISASSTTAQQNAVATLIYHCGVAVEMDYGPSGSASSIYYSEQVMPVYFRYNSSMSYISRSSYTSAAWLAILSGELDDSRPVLYRGSKQNGTGGHAFVIDGYTGTDYFHINWGWGGYLDGYFYLDNLTPSSNDFNYWQKMVLGIEPVQSSPPTLLSPFNVSTDLCVTPTLVWNSVSGATSYRLQVASDAAFNTVVHDDANLTGTSTQLSALSKNTTYFWRMNATSTSGTSAWSSPWSFTTMAAAITASGPASFCDGGSVDLSTGVVAGAGYAWSRNSIPIPGGTYTQISVTQSGSYTVSISVSGCTTISDPFTVTVNALPTASILPPANTEICEGGSTLLSATQGAGYSYQWLKNATNILGATGPMYSASESGTYAVQVTANGCTSLSSDLAITVHPIDPSQLEWTGAVSSDWSSTGNWDSPCAIPGLDDDVIIPTGCTPPTTIPNCTLHNLTINNSAGVSLSGNVTINGMLTLQQGKIALGNNDLTIGATGEIVGGSVGSHIVTDGMGQLHQKDIGSNGRYRQVFFPLGNASDKYVPLRMLNAASSNDFSVRVLDDVLEGAIIGNAITQDIVDNTWIVSHGSGATNITLSLFWPGSAESTGFDHDVCFMSSNPTGHSWTALHAGMQAQGSDPYSLTLTGITTLSSLGMPIAVGSGIRLYPVELVSFTADLIDNGVLLHWKTASEINNHGFEIQRRASQSELWQAIGFVSADIAMTDHHAYSHLDPTQVQGISYYRLRQIDVDGSSEYSPVLTVASNDASMPLLSEVLPQPLQQGSIGSVSLRADRDGICTLQLYDALGRPVRTLFSSSISAGSVHHVRIATQGLSAGIHFLRLSAGGSMLIRKFNVLK